MPPVSTIRRLRVGSRSSPLSRIQTEEALSQLRVTFPDTDFVSVPISTGGDRNKDAPLLSLGRGTFVKDIEVALLSAEVDFAVHSAKDIPPDLPDGLVLMTVGERQDPRDVHVNRWGLPLMKLPASARLGTSSPRRLAQIKAVRPDIEVLPIRGNLGTRLDKITGEPYDGVVLAAAGLLRLGRQAEITEYISPQICTPEVGQGMLAVEARSEDTSIIEMLAIVELKPTKVAFLAERAFLSTLGGGCKIPVTAYARLDGHALSIDAMAAPLDGSRIVRTQMTGDPDDPETAGRRVAEALLAAGAREVI